MRRIGLLGACCLVLATSACKVQGPSLSDDGPERDCTKPTLTVVGHALQHGPIAVHPGQTLRVRGREFTDDCANGAATGVRIPRLQLGLQSKYRVGPLATVRPRGEHAAFSAVVTIPAGTALGPATIFDTGGLAKPGIRLVVRR
jgi:hypothetical protein